MTKMKVVPIVAVLFLLGPVMSASTNVAAEEAGIYLWLDANFDCPIECDNTIYACPCAEI